MASFRERASATMDSGAAVPPDFGRRSAVSIAEPDACGTYRRRSVRQCSPQAGGLVYLSPLLELSCFLLKKDRSSLPNNEIPAFNEILGEDENLLASSIATWLVWSMKKQKLSEESELRLVSVLQNLIYTKNAQMIASMFLSDKKSFDRLA